MKGVGAVIVAAGQSSRFGGSSPKQFLFLAPLIKKFLTVKAIEQLVCVVPENYLASFSLREKISFVTGGQTRQESVRKGLEALNSSALSIVLIHDAARPFCSTSLIEKIIKSLQQGKKAVVPVIPPVDSVRIHGKSIDRSAVSLVQTPQGFDFNLLHDLHKKYKNANFKDDASMADEAGLEVTLIEGKVANKKLTFQEDLPTTPLRIGFGFDSHFCSADPQKKLKLCGVEVPNEKGLQGVSDADVAIHSLIDAILGATNRGSIGDFFPPSDPQFQGADSANLLRQIISPDFLINNIDMTIVCDRPKINSLRDPMTEKLADILKIKKDQINIKGKTTEGTNITGIAAYSTVLLSIFNPL